MTARPPIDLSGLDMASPLATALGLTQRGLRVVPIPHRSKNPDRKAWQHLRLTEEQLPQHFNEKPQNLGVLLGEPSNGYLDSDLDCPEAVRLGPVFLPETGVVFGRSGKPASHWGYQSSGPSPKSKKWTDLDDKTCLCELRSTGGQTVFPPSDHEGTGETVRFEKQGVAALVDPRALQAAMARLAAAALLARHWPTGSRQDSSLALAGGLLRSGWSQPETEQFIDAVARAAGDEEADKRSEVVSYTAARLEKDEETTGWTRLTEFVGAEVVARVRKWLDLPASKERGKKASAGGLYQARADGIYMVYSDGEEHQEERLSNFTAQITGDIIEDDGAEQVRSVDLRCALRGREQSLRIPVGSFGPMHWPFERLGPGAIVEAGMGTKDKLRVAIQHLSGPDIPRTTVFTHTGWRKVEEHGYVYLHAGGAIGPNGPVLSVETRLEGPLAPFQLPEPVTGEELTTAVHASLRLLRLAPLRISASSYAAIWRAILGGTDLTIFSVGKTGGFKSEHAALHQQHFGAGMHRLQLPGSFSGTDNALEDLMFRAKDTVFVLDDFKPSGSAAEDARLHAKADRLFRGAGNGTGRARMRADTSLRAPRPARALPFGTGEELPKGHSLRARIIALEIQKGDIDAALLTECQRDAAGGLYAQVTASFIRWCAGQLDHLRQQVRRRTDEIRAEMAAEHRRTPANLAALLAGLEVFFRFAVEATNEEALTRAEATAMLAECRGALEGLAVAQSDAQEEADPAFRYIKLLAAALASGHAHVANIDGGVPRDPESWGWREERAGRATEWRAKGDRIGWLEDDLFYLEPTAAYKAAAAMGVQGDGLPVTETRLRRLMQAQGMLRIKEGSRGKLTVRMTLQGMRREVLCVAVSLFQEPAQSAHSDQETPL